MNIWNSEFFIGIHSKVECLHEFVDKFRDQILKLVDDHFPSGSGFDAGTYFDFDESRENRLVIVSAFHHMDDYGIYCGWTHHSVIVTPDLAFGFKLRITGKDKRNIKEYIAEVFNNTLSNEIDEFA